MATFTDIQRFSTPNFAQRALLEYVRTVRDPGASVSADLFEAAAMTAVEKELLAMKVGELKEELEARGEGRTGNKALLRRRLHAAIVREYLGA